MTFRVRRPSAAMVVATLALATAVGGGTAYAATTVLAANSVGTKQLQNDAVTYRKLGDESVGLAKLSPAAKRAMTGARGATGATGARGPAGTPGAPGAAGQNGAPGRSAAGTTVVTTLGTTWVDHSSASGRSAVQPVGVRLSGPNGGGLPTDADYAGISTDALNAFTPAQLSTISYTASYRYTNPATPDPHRAAPYFKLKLKPADGACGDDDVVYNPSVQSDNLDYAGQTSTYTVTAPYSTVGVSSDDNPVDGAYPVATHAVTNGAGHDVSGEQICLAEIILDGGSQGVDATATVFDVTFAGAGLPQNTYVFGTS